MELITSRNNAKVKGARALRRRKARQEQGAFVVEGIRHVGEAVESGANVQAIFYAPDQLVSPYAKSLIQTQSLAGVPCYATTPGVFASLAGKENPQGILAVVQQPARALESLSPGNFRWGVALVSPQDPGNLGTILRTVDAVGANGLILLENSVDPYHPTAVRASMGTLFWLPVVSTSYEAFQNWAQKHRYHIYGTSAHAEADYRAVNYTSPCILLMGSEQEGLTQAQASICESLVRMPMRGRATSLNLAVATGVMLYAMIEKGL
jgi:TrmH family RNA methyltransferase